MSLVSPSQKLAGFQEEIQFEVLRRLRQAPQVSQRALAKDLGAGFDTINFCFQALVEKGLLKMQNFSQSRNKLRYAYLLTPVAIWVRVTLSDLKIIMKKWPTKSVYRNAS